MEESKEEKRTTSPAKFNRKNKMIFDISIVVVYFLVVPILIIGYHISDLKVSNLTLSLLIWVFGLLTGTLIAMIYSPFSEEEQSSFNTLSTAVVSFVTGYLTSKLFEPVLTNLADDPNFTKSIELTRLIIFTIGVLFGIISVYIYRKYYLQGKDVVYTDQKNEK